MMNSYSVVDGADLANLDPAEVTWAFTGANEVGNTNAYTVDLGYVAVNNDPDETTVYAYVDSTSDINRYQGADGRYYVDIDVVLSTGETATYTTAGTVQQMNNLYWRLYNWVLSNNYVELIVDGTTLIDVKDYYVGFNATVTAELVDSTIELNGQKYFVGNAEFISTVDGIETIGDLENGEVVRVYAERDSDGNLNIVMIGYDGMQMPPVITNTVATYNPIVKADIDRDGYEITVTVSKSDSNAFENGGTFNLVAEYDNGTTETVATYTVKDDTTKTFKLVWDISGVSMDVDTLTVVKA